jgi:hypothetical protein
MHSSFFGGIANYDFGGFSAKLKDGSALGLSIIRFGVDDIPDTRFLFDADGTLNYNNIQSFSAADYAFTLSYARTFSFLPSVNFGANFKVIHRNVGIFANAWGYGLDLGAQTTIKQWKVGVMARDITGTYNSWSINTETVADIFDQTGNTVPENKVEVALPTISADVARYFTIVKEPSPEPDATASKIGLLATAGFDLTFDGQRNVLLATSVVSASPKAGIEFDYKQLLFLRAGVGNFQQIQEFDGSQTFDLQPSFGLGIKFKNFNVDYALSSIGNQSETIYSNVFSINIFFNKLLPKAGN